MRRLVAAALAAGTVLAGTVAVAAPADAATHSWTSKNGWSTLKAYGTWSHTSKKATLKVWLADSKKNGWSPGVQFRTWTAGYKKSKYSSVFYFVDSRTGKPADTKFSGYRGAYTAGYPAHAYVREVGVRVSDRKLAAGPWKKLY
ncbi:hypothetical protein [Actinomadura atramentaria]|uniref:hypothetical protein n=1 Tax=Actinomadura atramentaria TaxID=1990 RepID=UPI00036187F0|nr:hypothetical protein [Actinomadura atramentaria]